MQIIERPIHYYTQRIVRGSHFAFAGYSDAEWICMFGSRAGELTGLGQVLSPEHGQKLLAVLRKRAMDENFIFAVPKILYSMGGFDGGQMDWFLGKHDIQIVANERDMVTDDLAASAGLFPFIRTIKAARHKVMIGNRDLWPMQEILGLDDFIGIDSPNLHMQENGIEGAVERALNYGKSGIYLISAGVSAAVIIDKLYDALPSTFLIDCGSMWDAFVGIGGQREWRAKLYNNPQELERWKKKNLTGK